MNSTQRASLATVAGAEPASARRTFLCADVDSFSGLTERLGDRGSFAIIRKVEAFVRRTAAGHRGEMVEVRGDGFLLAFVSARAATACALSISSGMERGAKRSRGVEPSLRMALHTGDVLQDGDRYFGRTLIAAFRLLERAAEREILVSAATATELMGNGTERTWERFAPKGLSGEMTFARIEGLMKKSLGGARSGPAGVFAAPVESAARASVR